MNDKNQKTKVFILGAGCSASCGYPVATSLVDNLETFGKTLGDKAPRLKACINETVTTMRKHSVRTVDDLAFRLHHNSFEAKTGSIVEDEHRRKKQILNAKLSVEALLLSKESIARRIGLQSYRDLLVESCTGAGGWDQKLRSSNCRVLTFNYDRLFELAMSSLVGPTLVQRGLYGYLLDSGFSSPHRDEISFNCNGFCYLKLHGSVGGAVNFSETRPEYYPVRQECELETEFEITDELIFPVRSTSSPLLREPLIVFPHEKHHVQSGGRHAVYERYLTTIWERAKAIISEANEIHIIGYSFAVLDKNSIINLLSAASNCHRIIIQNLPGEAERICRMLKIKHPDISAQLEPYPESF